MKKILLPLLALAAMASCTETDLATSHPSGQQIDESNIIKAKTNLRGVKNTRTPFDGDVINDQKHVIANVIAFNCQAGDPDNGDYTSVFYNGIMEFTNNTDPFGFTVPQFYPSKNVKPSLYLGGYYPNSTTDAPGTPGSSDVWTLDAQNSKISATIDGKTDLMATGTRKTVKEDAMTSTAAPKGNYKTITFQHLLTKLIFQIRGMQARWGQIKALQILAAGDTSQVTALPGKTKLQTLGLREIATVKITGTQETTIADSHMEYTHATGGVAPKLYDASSSNDEWSQNQTQQGSARWATRADGDPADDTAGTDPNAGQNDPQQGNDPNKGQGDQQQDDQQPKLLVDYTNDELTVPFDLSEWWKTIAYTMVEPIHTDQQQHYYLMIQTEKSEEDQAGAKTHQYYLEVSQLNEADNVTEYLGFTMGYQFVIQIDCSGTEIKAYAKVEPWKEGGKTVVDIDDDNTADVEP